MLIEQAIFTSAQTARSDGYQVVARSPGIDALDLREIAVYGPSHDALWEQGDDALSINFFPLPSGSYCVARSTAPGQEYSARRGPRVYTQCLVVTAETLAAFGNNALALLAAAFAQGHLRVYEQAPLELEPFRLLGRAVAVDEALLTRLLTEPGITWLQTLVEAAVTVPNVALLGANHSQRLLAGLIHCLPLECRLQFSFSTGLKYSPRRPFRIVCLGGKLAEQRRLAARYGLTVVEVSGKPPKEFTASSGWGGFVASSIAAGKTSFLAEQVVIARPGLTVAELAPLGDRLIDLMAAAGQDTGTLTDGATSESSDELVASTVAEPSSEERRADAAHPRFSRLAVGQATSTEEEWTDDPSHVVGGQCPAAIETLELLDDLVFEAIAGKPGALDELRRLWPEVLVQVGPSLVEESREQYLRHALRVWKECVDGDQIHNPSLALATMEVICLLFAER
ncbi:MAG TPA: hypothetical protein VFI31_12560 [Pirellulales bacterium]|nr:hypothetical protein [Pirellulales bacterium]